ncbi:MAG: hypothetical protein AMJ84_05360 [Acidithiobacillales bacterium SM23_46]|nr:MAG: hypothetical protein AMJ84_05360 [Acidithiobacillales bacterium SM23_46]
MRREIPAYSIALIALGFAVASAVFCWTWAARYSAAVETSRHKVDHMESTHEELFVPVQNPKKNEPRIPEISADLSVSRAVCGLQRKR